jgi:hypothetical protein
MTVQLFDMGLDTKGRRTRWHRLELLLREVTSRLGLNDVHSFSSFRIPQHEAYKQSDILHIHGTHSEFISTPLCSSLDVLPARREAPLPPLWDKQAANGKKRKTSYIRKGFSSLEVSVVTWLLAFP